MEAAGTGRLHTFSVLQKTPNPEFAADLPYVLAIVELDEGVRVSANIVGVDHDDAGVRDARPRRLRRRPALLHRSVR